jgi:hypothetical protein
MSTADLDKKQDIKELLNRQLTTADLEESDMEYFLSVGFTNHREIIRGTQTVEERLFYIRRCAKEFWNVETTKYHLKERLYQKEGTIQQTNFSRTISDTSKPMGVATYRTSQELPERLREALPDMEELKKLL